MRHVVTRLAGLIAACAPTACVTPEPARSASQVSISTGGDVRIELGDVPIRAVRLADSGERVLVLDESGVITVHDAESGRPFAAESRLGTDTAAEIVDVALSSDGRHVAWCTDQDDARRAYVVDAATGRSLSTIQAPGAERLARVRFEPAGRRLVVLASDGRVLVVDTRASIVLPWTAPAGGAGRDVAFDVLDPGLVCAWSSAPGRSWVALHDLRTGHATRIELRGGEAFAATRAGPLLLTREDPDETALVVRECVTGHATVRLAYEFHALTEVCFSPDGARLAIGTPDGASELFDLASGRLITRVEAEGVVFSGDGRSFCALDARGHVLLCSAEDGAPLESIEVDVGDSVTDMSLDRRGTRLAAGTAAGVVHVWRLDR